MTNQNHTFKFIPLTYEPNILNRKILENMYIYSLKPDLNQNSGLTPLLNNNIFDTVTYQ
jgi:hypothetical protein